MEAYFHKSTAFLLFRSIPNKQIFAACFSENLMLRRIAGVSSFYPAMAVAQELNVHLRNSANKNILYF